VDKKRVIGKNGGLRRRRRGTRDCCPPPKKAAFTVGAYSKSSNRIVLESLSTFASGQQKIASIRQFSNDFLLAFVEDIELSNVIIVCSTNIGRLTR
jgi:hypothetical protein